MRLNDWQLALESYLLGDPVEADAALQCSLLGGPTLSVERGLAIYHNAYRARLCEVLREDFPAVYYWLGDEQFEQLAAAYIKACPSARFSLRWFGQRFPDFIQQHMVAEQRNALVELARLEWQFTLAFDAAAAAPLTLEQMACLPAQAWPDLQVRLLPCVQHLQVSYNSLALWQAAKAGTDFPGSQTLAEPQLVLVWRQALVSHYRSLAADEAQALLGMCLQGWSFAQLCERLAEHAERAPLLAAGWLKQWISEALLSQPSSASVTGQACGLLPSGLTDVGHVQDAARG